MEWNRGMELWNGMIWGFGMEYGIEILDLLEIALLHLSLLLLIFPI